MQLYFLQLNECIQHGGKAGGACPNIPYANVGFSSDIISPLIDQLQLTTAKVESVIAEDSGMLKTFKPIIEELCFLTFQFEKSIPLDTTSFEQCVLIRTSLINLIVDGSLIGSERPSMHQGDVTKLEAIANNVEPVEQNLDLFKKIELCTNLQTFGRAIGSLKPIESSWKIIGLLDRMIQQVEVRPDNIPLMLCRLILLKQAVLKQLSARIEYESAKAEKA